MKSDLAVIGGTGISLEGVAGKVETPYGIVQVAHTELGGRPVLFIPRHGRDHLPPHRVDYRAIVSAARLSGARRVISTNTVGTMSYHSLGSIFIPLDFVEFTRSRRSTFFEDRAVHVEMSQPYCPQLRAILKEAARSLGLEPSEGVYVCTEGPHLESPAQIRMMRQFGDVVGMTGYPEVVLAKEAALCYASICIVTNPACGLGDGSGSTLQEISETIGRYRSDLLRVLTMAAENIPEERSCGCADSLSGSGV